MLHGECLLLHMQEFRSPIANFLYQVVSTTPAQYFKAKRGIANGIVYAGGGLGGTVISFILDALLASVGIEWTFRILGFLIIATGIPAAYLVKERAPIRPTKMLEWYDSQRLLNPIRVLSI